MKPQLFKILMISLAISLVSCNKEEKVVFTEYKFADKPEVVTCAGLDTKLLNEALYAFEEDISKYYKTPNSNISRAYSRLISESTINRIKVENVLSEHTLKVFEAIKKDKDIWKQNGTLNYQSKLIKCISENIKNDRLKSTFNALLSTNSLSPNLFGEPLKSNAVMMLSDKYLATYVALEFYYSNLFDVDLTTINFDKPAPSNIDFNKKPQD